MAVVSQDRSHHITGDLFGVSLGLSRKVSPSHYNPDVWLASLHLTAAGDGVADPIGLATLKCFKGQQVLFQCWDGNQPVLVWIPEASSRPQRLAKARRQGDPVLGIYCRARRRS